MITQLAVILAIAAPHAAKAARPPQCQPAFADGDAALVAGCPDLEESYLAELLRRTDPLGPASPAETVALAATHARVFGAGPTSDFFTALSAASEQPTLTRVTALIGAVSRLERAPPEAPARVRAMVLRMASEGRLADAGFRSMMAQLAVATEATTTSTEAVYLQRLAGDGAAAIVAQDTVVPLLRQRIAAGAEPLVSPGEAQHLEDLLDRALRARISQPTRRELLHARIALEESECRRSPITSLQHCFRALDAFLALTDAERRDEGAHRDSASATLAALRALRGRPEAAAALAYLEDHPQLATVAREVSASLHLTVATLEEELDARQACRAGLLYLDLTDARERGEGDAAAVVTGICRRAGHSFPLDGVTLRSTLDVLEPAVEERRSDGRTRR